MMSFSSWCHPELWVEMHDSCITAVTQILQWSSVSDTMKWISHIAHIVDASTSSFFLILKERLKAHTLLSLFLSSSIINRFSFINGNGGTGRALLKCSDNYFPANTPSSPAVRSSCLIGPIFKFWAVVSSSNILLSCCNFSLLKVRFFPIIQDSHQLRLSLLSP